MIQEFALRAPSAAVQASQPNLPGPPNLPRPAPDPELPVEPKPGKEPLPIDPYPTYEDVPPPKPIDATVSGSGVRFTNDFCFDNGLAL